MKLNKTRLGLFILIMACLLFISISSVSAANDVNVTSFKEMNTQIQAGNDVNLVNDIKGLDGLTEGIIITGKTTINGNGHSIDAQSTGRFFEIKSSGVLTLKNITLKNGKCRHGSAIINYGTLTITGSTLRENIAYWDDAGAIINDGGTLTITGSTFINNKAASDGPPSSSKGGAICNYKGTLTVTNSTFLHNSAHHNGGAIYNRGTLTVIGSTFNYNKAGITGGAIYSSNTFTCTGSNFKGNTANDGGAIYTDSCLYVKNCIFTENKASRPGVPISAEGGAIRCYNLGECKNCTFIKNTADNGGAIAIKFGTSTYTVRDCIFQENTATGSGINGKGGAIFLNKIKSTINLIHNQWINNHAKNANAGDNVFTWGYYGTIEYNYFVGSDYFIEHKTIGANKKHYDPKRCNSIEEWNKHYSSNIVKPDIKNTHHNLVKAKDMVKLGTVKSVSKNTEQADNSTVNNTAVNSDMDLFAMINSLINFISSFISDIISLFFNPLPAIGK